MTYEEQYRIYLKMILFNMQLSEGNTNISS